VCVCVDRVSFVTSSGQIHEPWERYNDQGSSKCNRV
jgi:hypothetical protein